MSNTIYRIRYISNGKSMGILEFLRTYLSQNDWDALMSDPNVRWLATIEADSGPCETWLTPLGLDMAYNMRRKTQILCGHIHFHIVHMHVEDLTPRKSIIDENAFRLLVLSHG